MSKRRQAPDVASCPCGTGSAYAQCCGRFHAGAAAPDAAALMRSRYAAYVLADEAYLLATWHRSTRPARLGLPPPGTQQWLGLDVRRHEAGAALATVEFVARSRVGGRARRLHETSRFVREDGRWYYMDGDVAAPPG